MKILGILVTYQRPDAFRYSLEHIFNQTPPGISKLVVIDNDPSAGAAEVVEEYRSRGMNVDYLPSRENLGPAGGRAVGSKHLLEEADDDDWVMFFDDRRAIPRTNLIEELARFAEATFESDPSTAGVGLIGTRFDTSRALARRPDDEELAGPVKVDSLHGGRFPMYRAAVVRKLGVDNPKLLYGWVELEFGLRLKEAGHTLYMHGTLWKELRDTVAPLRRSRPRLRLAAGPLEPRRYYALRNMIRLLLDRGRYFGAARVIVIRGLAKPLANMVLSPRRAWPHLVMNTKAIIDGISGRSGQTLELKARSYALRPVDDDRPAQV